MFHWLPQHEENAYLKIIDAHLEIKNADQMYIQRYRTSRYEAEIREEIDYNFIQKFGTLFFNNDIKTERKLKHLRGLNLEVLNARIEAAKKNTLNILAQALLQFQQD